jgi:competence protein ComEC
VELNLLAVGNAQCAVLQVPGTGTVLVDAGARRGPDPYARVLVPFLHEQRIPRPEAAFMSHANSDHYNVLPPLIVDGHVKRAYVSEYFAPDADPESPISRLCRLIDARCHVTRLGRGSNPDLGRAIVEVLWPPPGSGHLESNDRSLVLRLSYQGRSILFTGDIGEAAQARLCLEPERIRSDVLVLPHHGIWTDALPDLIRAVDPEVVLASCGPGPDPDEPAPARIEELFEALGEGRQFYCTSRDGWIRLRIGREGMEVETMKGGIDKDP